MRHQTLTELSGSATEGMITVDDLLIVDDHPLMCEALTMALRVAFGMRQARCERRSQSALNFSSAASILPSNANEIPSSEQEPSTPPSQARFSGVIDSATRFASRSAFPWK